MPQPYPLPGGGQAGYRSRAVAVRPARVALTSVAVEPISEHVQVRGGIPWRPGNPMNSLEEKRKLADPGRSTGLESGGLRKPRALERRNTTRAAATNRTRRSPRVTSRAVVILRNRPSSYADVIYEAARKKLSDCRLVSNQQFVRGAFSFHLLASGPSTLLISSSGRTRRCRLGEIRVPQYRRVRGLSSPWRAVPLRHMEEVWLEDESDPD